MRKNHYAKNELCQQKSQSHIGKLLDHGLECKFCDESFGFKEDLIGHMRTHSINTIQNKGNFSVPIKDYVLEFTWTAGFSGQTLYPGLFGYFTTVLCIIIIHCICKF